MWSPSKLIVRVRPIARAVLQSPPVRFLALIGACILLMAAVPIAFVAIWGLLVVALICSAFIDVLFGRRLTP